jgi:SPP1 family predicted phage head-tail adaptor
MHSAVRSEFAGTMNRRITLESPSETGGDAVVSYTTQATVWAEVEGLSGANRTGLMAEMAYRFTIRFRADLVSPTIPITKWRVGMSGTTRKFQITQPPLDPDGNKTRMVVMAQELI